MSARLGGKVSDGVQPLEGRNSARLFDEHRDLLMARKAAQMVSQYVPSSQGEAVTGSVR